MDTARFAHKYVGLCLCVCLVRLTVCVLYLCVCRVSEKLTIALTHLRFLSEKLTITPAIERIIRLTRRTCLRMTCTRANTQSPIRSAKHKTPHLPIAVDNPDGSLAGAGQPAGPAVLC